MCDVPELGASRRSAAERLFAFRPRRPMARCWCLSARSLGLDSVIASQRVGAKRRPMTGSAKQSTFCGATKEAGLLRRKGSSQ